MKVENLGVRTFLTNRLGAMSRVGNLDSIVVTIPHKFACYEFCDSTTDRAAFLGAVNMMRRSPQGWHGDMTDGQGMMPSFGGQLSADHKLALQRELDALNRRYDVKPS